MLAGQIDGHTVRSLRLEKELRQKDFAALAEVSAFYLRQIELHGHQPSEIIIRRIARALDVSPDQLMRREADAA